MTAQPATSPWRIPLSDLTYDEVEEQAVLGVVRSKWLSMGPRTEEFEAACASYLGVKHAIAVANCTCALELAYKAVFLGDEITTPRLRRRRAAPVVIAPDITFVATVNAAAMSGATVKVVDTLDLAAPIIRSAAVARKLADGASGHPTAIAAVHYAGFDAGSDELARLAETRGTTLIEDAAHAIGGRSASGRMLGTTGKVGCFSFFANKNLSTGEGGLVTTDDDALAARIRLLRSHGMTTLTWERHSTRGHGYDVVAAGHNYRITEIVAALGLAQLAKLDAGNQRRRELYRRYRDAFRASDRLWIPFGDSDDAITRSACHIFPLLVASPALRDKVRAALSQASVQTSHHYPPLHLLSFWNARLQCGPPPPPAALGDDWPLLRASFSRGGVSFPAATHFSAREITLPLHPGLKDIEADEVASIVLKTVAGA